MMTPSFLPGPDHEKIERFGFRNRPFGLDRPAHTPLQKANKSVGVPSEATRFLISHWHLGLTTRPFDLAKSVHNIHICRCLSHARKDEVLSGSLFRPREGSAAFK